jgi:hypothetical protein
MEMPHSRKVARDTTRRYRERMRARGFRQVNLWLPDTRSPAFARECKRQSRLASRPGRNDDIDGWLDDALREIDGWTE